MLDLALKNINGHKLRSFLTVLGIVIAIGAVVSLGSISEGMNSLARGQAELFGGVIVITEAGTEPSFTSASETRIDIDVLDDIKEIKGVEDATAALIMQLPMRGVIIGTDLNKLDIFALEYVEMEEGRWPDSEQLEIAIGYSVAENQDLLLGDYVSIQGTELEIVGIIEQLDTFFDLVMLMEFKTAQDVFDEYEYANIMYAKVIDYTEVREIADEIKSTHPNLDARATEDQLELADDVIGNVRIVTLGIGFIAAFVAAIGIVNTMFMSVSERTREIGIMKAVGANEWQIMKQVLQESIVLSLFGGVVGLLFGYVGTSLMNLYIGMPLAKITPLLATASLSFGVFLSVLSAYYPAVKASEIDPISAIKGVK